MPGTTTLRTLTAESDVVARVRIVDPANELVVEEPPTRENVVVAERLATLKGPGGEGTLRFVQHGHGVPRYRKGEEAVVFLQSIGRSRELGRTAIAAHVTWFSPQEAGDHFPVDDGTREGFVRAVRAYVRIETLPPEQRLAALRRTTRDLLASPQARLARSALRDLRLAPEAPLLAAEDLPVFERVVRSPSAAIGVRTGLLGELERRKLVEGGALWAELLRTTTGSDRIAVARAAGAHPSPAVTRELVALLGSEDPLLVSTAAVSLGSPGNEPAVGPLEKLLASEEPRVRTAAIRALGAIGSGRARQALAAAAEGHPEPATRRRAAAELTRQPR